MIHVIAIAGAPGSGKSSLMKELICEFAKQERAAAGKELWAGPEPIECGLVRGYYYEASKTVVIGVYENGEKFPGTDRLSMAVQPMFLGLLEEMNASANWHGTKILFEGDRLTNKSVFETMDAKNIEYSLFILRCSDEELKRRYAKRGSNQPETFIKGRNTKIERVKAYIQEMHAARNPFRLIDRRSDIEEDIADNAAFIKGFIAQNAQA